MTTRRHKRSTQTPHASRPAGSKDPDRHWEYHGSRGIRRIDQWSRIEHAVGPMETRYVRARGYEKVLSEMTLSLEKLSILTGLDVEQDVGTICRNSTLSHFEVCRTLWAYRVIGVVQRLA